MTRKLWVGLDVGVETTSICVIDDTGEILQQVTCKTTVESVHNEIRWLIRRRFARIGLEAASGAALARGLRSLGYSVDLYETRKLSKFLRVRRNKTDAGDALGIAEAGRVGASLVSKVYLKNLDCQSLQSRLVIRRYLIRQRVAAVNLLCRQIELYGGRLSRSTRSLRLRESTETEIRKVFGKGPSPLTAELLRLLDHCERLIAHQQAVDRQLIRLSQENDVCRRFMEIPGVGPICALTFYAAIGDPQRFKPSENIGSYLGLTPRLYQSGLTSRLGRISKMGNRAARSMLVHAGVAFMQWSSADAALRHWASQIQLRRGKGKARVALARKLAVVMLAMWKTGEVYRPELSMDVSS